MLDDRAVDEIITKIKFGHTLVIVEAGPWAHSLKKY